MSSVGFTLGDRLGLKVAECKVRGCTRTWTDLSTNRAFADAPGRNDETRGMCESCQRRWPKLADREMPCARPGCEHTWQWSRQSQLESLAAGRPEPKQFCGDCEDKLKGLEPVEITCVVPGCGRTNKLTPKQQLLGEAGQQAQAQEGGITLTGPLCARCAERSPHIVDVQVACGIQKCKRTWTWRADEQIVQFAAGKPKDPPRRMCEPCRDSFGALVDRDVRCRASGCKRTWTWTREQQLDACTADKPVPKPPAHLCEECFKVWGTLQDAERPCRRSGCKNTWIEKRGAQLARILRGKTGEPFPQFCASCEGQVEQLKDREIPCKSEGCKRTWTWTAQQQFVAGARPEFRKELPGQQGGAAASGEAGAPSEAIGTGGDGGEGNDGNVRRRRDRSAARALRAPTVADEPKAELEAPATLVESQPAETAATADHADLTASASEDESSESSESDPTPEVGGDAIDSEPQEATAISGPQTAESEGKSPGGKSGKSRRRRRRRNSVHAPSRHCQFCASFLGKAKTVELPCAACGTPIFWPPESQLQTELGNWEIPKLCGACKRDATEADRQRAKGELMQQAQKAMEGHDSAVPSPATDAGAPPAEDAPPSET